MKKVAAILLSIGLLYSLVACSSESVDQVQSINLVPVANIKNTVVPPNAAVSGNVPSTKHAILTSVRFAKTAFLCTMCLTQEHTEVR